MAAASSPETIALSLIADIVRKTCAKYTWNKRDSTYKTFLKHLTNFAENAGISLADMADSSLKHARDVDYSKISVLEFKTNMLEPSQRFQNIPYIIYVDENNITTVIIKKGNIDCPLKEITPDMMQVLSYLGIVRVIAIGLLPIPCWPDNIINLETLNYDVMHHLDTQLIRFPEYLRSLVDKSEFVGTYTNRLPPHLTILSSACTETQNLSPTLKKYSFTGIPTTEVLANAEYLPFGMNSVVYSTTCLEFHNNEITMPLATKYLEIGFYRIHSKTLMIKNVEKLYIYAFKVIEQWKDYESPNTNLIFEYSACSGNCCNYYTQQVEVILEEGIQCLVINTIRSFELLSCIKQIPSSLHTLLILNININTDKTTYEECRQSIQDFITRFPHIQYKFTATN